MSIKRKRQSLLGVLFLAIAVCFVVPFVGDQTRYVNVYAQTHLGKVHLGKVSLNQGAAGGSTHDTSTFGSTVVDNFVGFPTTSCFANEYQAHYYTASTGDSIISVRIHLQAPSSSGPHHYYVALYDVDGSNLANNLIYTSTDSISYVDSEGPSWKSVDVTWGLTNGTEYTLAIGNMSQTGNPSIYYDDTGPPDSASQSTTSPFADPWDGTKETGYGAIGIEATYVSEL